MSAGSFLDVSDSEIEADEASSSAEEGSGDEAGSNPLSDSEPDEDDAVDIVKKSKQLDKAR